MDVRWVYKWKFDKPTQDITDTSKQAEARRVIRARLCLRGFKDLDKDNVAKYAGTSQRHTQRILCSEAVVQQWDIWNTDISKAFLQGINYEEHAELTGEPLREVNFYLPAAIEGCGPSTSPSEGLLEGFDKGFCRASRSPCRD